MNWICELACLGMGFRIGCLFGILCKHEGHYAVRIADETPPICPPPVFLPPNSAHIGSIWSFWLLCDIRVYDKLIAYLKKLRADHWDKELCDYWINHLARRKAECPKQ